MIDREALIAAARAGREYAHARFSHFRVGAAVQGGSGRVFTGCNVENATYGLTLCAERVAIFKALSRRGERLRGGGRGDRHGHADAALRACRQILWEFCGDVEVILANLAGRVEVYRMAALFPSRLTFRICEATRRGTALMSGLKPRPPGFAGSAPGSLVYSVFANPKFRLDL